MRKADAPIATVLWMAWRQLVARKRAGLSFMTIMSILGVSVGVWALVVVLSVMAGFERDLRERMLSGHPHLEILNEVRVAGFPLSEYPLSLWHERFPEATAIQPFTQADVVLRQRQHMTAATVVGLDPSEPGQVWGFRDGLIVGALDELASLHPPIVSFVPGENLWPGIILGDGLAVQLSADLGDEITIVSPQGVLDPGSVLTGGTLTRRYVVVGLFRTGQPELDSRTALVSLAEGRQFMADYDQSLDDERYVSGVAMVFEDPYEVSRLEQRVAAFPQLIAQSWKSVNKSLLFALKLEKFTMGAILMLIVLIASFSISGTMMMTVYHRRKQVSLLRAVGMTKGAIARLFLTHGFIIGTIGIICGVSVGVLSCFVVDHVHLNLPGASQMPMRIPVRYLPGNYAVICLAAWLFSLAASTYPAMTAARQDPCAGLRL